MPRRFSVGLALGALVATSLTTPASATEEFGFDRIGGGDRYATAALVAAAHDGGQSAILVNGSADNYVDALTANYLAGELEAPVLLTKRDATPSVIRAQLAAENITDVVVVGGDVAISDEQVVSLEQHGYDVRRVAGVNRFETNAAVIDAAGAAEDGIGLVATGYDFADSLAGGPLVYQGHPLALSRPDRMDGVVLEALQGAGVTKVYVLGGPIAVSADVVAQLDSAGISVIKRLSGAERASTSVAIAAELIAQHDFSADRVNVASGNNTLYGADALSGGPLTGQQNSPLLITNSAGNASRSLDTFLGDHCATLSTGVLFGGVQAISETTQARLETAAQSCDAEDVTDPVLTNASASVEADVVTASVTAIDDVAVDGVEAALLDVQGAVVAERTAAASGDVHGVSFPGVNDGTYTVRFTATDTSGNSAQATTSAVEVADDDVTDPVLSGLAASVEGDTVNASVTVVDDVAVDGVEAALLDVQGAVVAERTAAASGDVYGASFPGVDDGMYTVRFTATDTSGNSAQATTSAVEVADDDVTGPVLSGLAASVEGDTVSASVTVVDDVAVDGVDAALLDAQGAVVAEQAAAASGDVYEVSFASVDDGTYNVRFTATDTSGNTAQATTSAVEVADDDVTPPTLAAPVVRAENDSVLAEVIVVDDVEIQDVQADLLDAGGSVVESSPAQGSEFFHVAFEGVADGTYSVRFTATDTSGNVAQLTTDLVVVAADVSAPVLTEPDATVDGDAVTSSVTVTDDSGVESVKVELLNSHEAVVDTLPGVVSGDSYSTVFSNVADGTYTVRFTATDIWDNSAQAESAAVVVDTTLKVGEPYIGNDGLTVTLNSVTVTETTGSYQYRIAYTLSNETDGAIYEGSWKAYDLDGGETLAQYGFFGRLFPGETLNRSYVFEEEKSVGFDVVAYHSDQFFDDYPPSDALVWRVPEAQ